MPASSPRIRCCMRCSEKARARASSRCRCRASTQARSAARWSTRGTSCDEGALNMNREAPHTRRWTEQRWMIDNVIRSVGIDWDQPRSINYNAPCGPEANADFAGIRERVKKYADISPAFENAARRREAKAKAAEEAGEHVTARQNYFIAAIQYAASQWPYDENNEKNLALNQRKRECYTCYAHF